MEAPVQEQKQRRMLTRLRPRTLYSRICLVFFAFTTIFFLLLVVFWSRTWSRFLDYSDQYLHWGFAQELAAELKPYLEDARLEKLTAKILEIKRLNPRFEVLVVGRSGDILFSLGGVKRNHLDTAAIETFLAQENEPPSPIYIEDPFTSAGIVSRTVFSAARVTMNHLEAYLLVTIPGPFARRMMAYLGEAELIGLSYFWIGCSFLGVFLLGAFSFNRITRRFTRMTASVASYADGAYDTRLPQDSDDEVGLLAKTFNSMAEKIEGNIAKLNQNDELRRRLAVNIAHDLRGPLTSIQGFLEVLRLKHATGLGTEGSECVHYIARNVSHLSKLTDSLFELSKLEGQEGPPVMEPIRLDELADEVLQQYGPRAADAGLSLELDAPGTVPEVMADGSQIERVFINLIENAFRYTDKGGFIRISLRVFDQHVVASVQDSGCGIAEVHLGHLFDRFYRVGEDRSKHTGGSGLGLAIVKHIVESHGGTVDVESKVGSGTTFSFRLSRA